MLEFIFLILLFWNLIAKSISSVMISAIKNSPPFVMFKILDRDWQWTSYITRWCVTQRRMIPGIATMLIGNRCQFNIVTLLRQPFIKTLFHSSLFNSEGLFLREGIKTTNQFLFGLLKTPIIGRIFTVLEMDNLTSILQEASNLFRIFCGGPATFNPRINLSHFYLL